MTNDMMQERLNKTAGHFDRGLISWKEWVCQVEIIIYERLDAVAAGVQ